MLRNSHKQVQFLNFCYSSTIQMVWVIFLHVIIEVIDISLTSKACLSRQVHFLPFFILKLYQFWWNGWYYYSFILICFLIHLEWRSSSFRLHQIFQSLRSKCLKINFLKKFFQECQMVWIQISTDILSVLV